MNPPLDLVRRPILKTVRHVLVLSLGLFRFRRGRAVHWRVQACRQRRKTPGNSWVLLARSLRGCESTTDRAAFIVFDGVDQTWLSDRAEVADADGIVLVWVIVVP